MPTGLDGNPDPIRTAARDAVLVDVALEILSKTRSQSRVAVAVDGASGAGTSTFADELARHLGPSLPATQVVRATTDSFHQRRVERYARGRHSPEGYFFDSHDLALLRRVLLEPFVRGGSRVVTEAFDEPTDTPLRRRPVGLAATAVLIFDGLFLQRPELADYWDLVIYLAADQRLQQACPGDRYRRGQRLYEDSVDPRSGTDILIDNNDLVRPVLIRQR